MKELTFNLICLLIAFWFVKISLGSVITVKGDPDVTTQEWVNKHKLLLPFFKNVCEPTTNTEILRLSEEFNLDPEASKEEFMKDGIIEKLQALVNNKILLPKVEVFSEYKTHFNEIKTLYQVFYYAKDFKTFLKAVSWARVHVNCGVYIDAVYSAIITRKDTNKLTIPPPYELVPSFFFKKNVISKVTSILAGNKQILDGVQIENDTYILTVNYTDVYNTDAESKLAYFREDVGLSSFYFMWKIKNSLRINPINFNSIAGEYTFFTLKEDSARYDLERYSNNLPETEALNSNALTTKQEHSAELDFIKSIENNLTKIVADLKLKGHNKTQILNHIMNILIFSENNYETAALRLLAKVNSNKSEFPLLEHFLTSVRDPAYWNLNKQIIQLVENALKVLPSYNRDELFFPGVELLNAEVENLTTYFEDFQIDVSECLKNDEQQKPSSVKIVQPRLNHNPFTININISSSVEQKGIVKLYLGPKISPGEFNTKKRLFLLLDRFDLDLKSGVNVATRSSYDIKYFRNDYTSLKTLQNQVHDAELGLDILPLSNILQQIGYPRRLMLPKGLPDGLNLKLFVFVAPFYKPSHSEVLEYNHATLSPGYPIDLDVDENLLLDLPNSLLKDITITHKE